MLYEKEGLMTKYEILLCIYYYLDNAYWENMNKSNEYIYYISNVNPELWKDGGTADPAYYVDFLEICNSFFKESECSVQDGFYYAKKYLDEYNVYEHTKYHSDIDEVVDVFSKCTLSEWNKIYECVKG